MPLTEEFPFVEWGILLHKSNEGKPRYPSFDWIKSLADFDLPLSGHICGQWVRDICAGEWTILRDHPEIWPMFKRFQLNFRNYDINKINFVDGLKSIPHYEEKTYILQLQSFDDELLKFVQRCYINANAVFDKSGGNGVEPDYWPHAPVDQYVGYAGGLSPDNLERQLNAISTCENKMPIWIDAETHLRTDDKFDLDKCRKFLEIASKWVI